VKFSLLRKGHSDDLEQSGDNRMFEITNLARKSFAEGFNITVVPTGNSFTLSAHGTFTAADGRVLFVDGGGASRNFNPSGTFDRWSEVVVINVGATNNIVFDSAGANQTIVAGAWAHCFFDGADWH